MMARDPQSVWRVSLLLVLLPLCSARQHYRARFPNGIAVPCPPDQDCAGEVCEGVGHLSCLGGAVTPLRNPFGEDFELSGLHWTRELCEKDSDGDGFTNGEELGDPCCIWHEGASVPSWMTSEEWEVTHPGFASSKPEQPIDTKSICADTPNLEPSSFYNDGEEQKIIDYIINEREVPAQETTYDRIPFNLPDDREYQIVGIQPLVDNEEMVHHFVMYGCSVKTDTPGVVDEFYAMNEFCEEALYGWAPGVGNLTVPKHAGFPVGNGSHVGFQLEIHYDNPLRKEGRRDASGLRVYMTPNARPDQIGILWAGSVVSVGLIPPGETDVYSSTLCQLKIDEEVAPGGIQVFAVAPHMHLLGRRLWSDHLVMRPTDEDTKNRSIVTDLNQLEKIDEIARDDLFDFNVQYTDRIAPTSLRNGDYVATTCVYDSRDREEVTSGGPGSYDEMCINFLYYYPAAGTESLLHCSGPRYFGMALPRTYTSFLEIANASAEGTQIPTWRQAYLSGELRCEPTGYDSVGFARRRSRSLEEQLAETCGKAVGEILLTGNETLSTQWLCSEECAKLLYNHMGCALLEDALGEDGAVFSLIASPLEILVEASCNEEFIKFYEKEKVPTNERGT